MGPSEQRMVTLLLLKLLKTLREEYSGNISHIVEQGILRWSFHCLYCIILQASSGICPPAITSRTAWAVIPWNSSQTWSWSPCPAWAVLLLSSKMHLRQKFSTMPLVSSGTEEGSLHLSGPWEMRILWALNPDETCSSKLCMTEGSVVCNRWRYGHLCFDIVKAALTSLSDPHCQLAPKLQNSQSHTAFSFVLHIWVSSTIKLVRL